MFAPIDIENVQYQLKPMNCPFHITIYKSQLRSYRELPFRYAELGTVYRFERSGVLHGLMRVRGFTQDDAHLFCRPDQLEDEIVRVLDFVTGILKAFGFERYDIYVSTRPAEGERHRRAVGGRHRGPAARPWRSAASPTRSIPGEGVFYGPEDRHQDQGLAGPRLAVLDHPGRLPQPEPLRPRVHRRGRQGPPAGDGPPRAAGQPGALLRRAHRALRGRVPALAGARAGGGDPGGRAAPGVRRGRSRRSCAPRASASTWTTATRSWATRSARPRCRRSPTCSWWGTRKSRRGKRLAPPPPRRRPRRHGRRGAGRPDREARGGASDRRRSAAGPARRCPIDNKTVRINDRIRAKEVRVIDDDGVPARHHAARSRRS